jgi:hypothetical protein
MKKQPFFSVTLILLCTLSLTAQKKVIFSTVPADAGIYLEKNNEFTLLAQGNYELRIGADEVYTIKVWKEGFEPFIKSYTRANNSILTENVMLLNRVVKIVASPVTAEVYVDNIFFGKGGEELDVPVKNNTITNIEIRGEGYQCVRRTYYNMENTERPPLKENIELTDRLVKILTDPPGCEITVDGRHAGETSAEIVVPKGNCIAMKVSKDGFAPVEKSYCNKPESAMPPKSEDIILKDRIVQINVTPEDATIRVDGKAVGKGSYTLLVKRDQCAEIEVMKDGFDTNKKSYCNKTSMSEPPVTDHIRLPEDEAWLSSIRSDQANVNFSIPVNPKLGNDAAWKIIGQIVMEKFDVIEISDPVTGYLRTAWNVKLFGNGKTVRTRCIVKLGNTDPLRYVIKIVSEESIIPGASVKEDEKFREWDRILNAYKDIIGEIQARIS